MLLLDPLWPGPPLGGPPLDWTPFGFEPPLTDPLWRTPFNPESLPLGLPISLLGITTWYIRFYLMGL